MVSGFFTPELLRQFVDQVCGFCPHICNEANALSQQVENVQPENVGYHELLVEGMAQVLCKLDKLLRTMINPVSATLPGFPPLKWRVKKLTWFIDRFGFGDMVKFRNKRRMFFGLLHT